MLEELLRNEFNNFILRSMILCKIFSYGHLFATRFLCLVTEKKLFTPHQAPSSKKLIICCQHITEKVRGTYTYLTHWRETKQASQQQLESKHTVCQCPCKLGACLLGGVGAHGWVVRFYQPLVQSPYWSWLWIVEALGCLRLPNLHLGMQLLSSSTLLALTVNLKVSR